MPVLPLLRGQSVAGFLSFFLPTVLAQFPAGSLANASSALIGNTQSVSPTAELSSSIGSASTVIQSVSAITGGSSISVDHPSVSVENNVTSKFSPSESSAPISDIVQATNFPISDVTGSSAELPVSTTASFSSPTSSVSSTPSTLMSMSNATTSSAMSPPTFVDGFELIGCVGPIPDEVGFRLIEESAAMTVDRCVSNCMGFAYAGVFDTLCYCAGPSAGSMISPTVLESCDAPCPGKKAETCGGRFSKTKRSLARRTPSPDVFLTVYASLAISESAAISSPLPSTSSIAAIAASSKAVASSTPQINGTTASDHTTVLTTVYTDICRTGYTTKTATLTTTHCACTRPGANSLETPTIPMTTVEKTCTVCAGPETNSPSTVTLTVPETAAITSVPTGSQLNPVPPNPDMVDQPQNPPQSPESAQPAPNTVSATVTATATVTAIGSAKETRRVTLVYITADSATNPPIAMYTGAAVSVCAVSGSHLISLTVASLLSALAVVDFW